MISEYQVVKNAANLRARLGLAPVRYLEDDLEPELAALLDEAKIKQRSGRLSSLREAADELDCRQILRHGRA